MRRISLKHFEKILEKVNRVELNSEKMFSARVRALSGEYTIFREFDPGSGLTLAACITHSSRTERIASVILLVADG